VETMSLTFNVQRLMLIKSVWKNAWMTNLIL